MASTQLRLGFNNWSALTHGLNEAVFIEKAHATIDFTLLEAGYNHINLDDCWGTLERA